MKKSEENLTLPDGYSVKNIGYWALTKFTMGTFRVVYKCKAQSEAGARRESLLYLSGALDKMKPATAKKKHGKHTVSKKK